MLLLEDKLLSNGRPFMCSQHKDVSFHEQHKHQAFMGSSEAFWVVVPWQRRFLFHWFGDSLSSQSKLTSLRLKVMKTPVASTEVTERGGRECWTSWLRQLIFQQLSLNQYRVMAAFTLKCSPLLHFLYRPLCHSHKQFSSVKFFIYLRAELTA